MDVFARFLPLGAVAVLLAACASAPPPTLPNSALADAQTAISQAEQADADRYAAVTLDNARSKLTAAKNLLGPDQDDEDKYDDARRLAEEAAADAELARAEALAKQAEAHAQAAQEKAAHTPALNTPQPLNPPGGAS